MTNSTKNSSNSQNQSNTNEENLLRTEKKYNQRNKNMNNYKKYCPNFFCVECGKEYKKGDVITITTKYGKENEHIIYNFLKKINDKFYYSITRADGFNSQERAKNKMEKLNSWAIFAEKRSNNWHEQSNEGRDFLSLGEPIKIGHHSEGRHHRLIERNHRRIEKSINEREKAENYQSRSIYWEKMKNKIDLSMPESLDFFKFKLDKAIAFHTEMKNGKVKKEHNYSLVYAKKAVNDLIKKVETAQILWGENKSSS